MYLRVVGGVAVSVVTDPRVFPPWYVRLSVISHTRSSINHGERTRNPIVEQRNDTLAGGKLLTRPRTSCVATRCTLSLVYSTRLIVCPVLMQIEALLRPPRSGEKCDIHGTLCVASHRVCIQTRHVPGDLEGMRASDSFTLSTIHAVSILVI